MGCSCSYRTLSSWLRGNDLEPVYSKRKKPPYEILRSGDERSWYIRFPRNMERKVRNVSWGNRRHPEIQNSFLERNNVEKTVIWGSIVTHGWYMDLKYVWPPKWDVMGWRLWPYSESVARHSTSWEGFDFSHVLWVKVKMISSQKQVRIWMSDADMNVLSD